MIKLNRRLLLWLALFLTAFVIFRFATIDDRNRANDEKTLVKIQEKLKKERAGNGDNLIEEVQEDPQTDTKCYYDNQCALPQMLFRVRTETDNLPPFACLNDIKLFDTENIGRGVNVAVLNGTTGDIIEKATFDVTASDEKLMTWLLKIPHASLLVAASFGDVAEHVSRQCRQLFEAFGAQKIDGWRVGSAYAIIGQRGIKRGEAHEIVSKFLDDHSAGKLFEGCFELPIAETTEVELKVDGPPVHRADESKLAELGAFEADLLQNKDVEYGDKWKNCGMSRACNEQDSIPVHFFSGEHKDDHPKMCIGGKMLFDKDLNKAGRGLNLAMLEPKTGKVTAVAHFDTYEDGYGIHVAVLVRLRKPCGFLVGLSYLGF
uniref:ILEI domain-containing protein n=1 Tax=Caenorhabditis tropicalis TaxID=1561998 RepID=A0A1I7TQG5_9PELO